jgi:glycosyltransferase involved in cell wall biosynthesis
MDRINLMQIVDDLNYGGMQRVAMNLCLKVDHSKFKLMVCCLEELGPNAEELRENGVPLFLVKKSAGIDYFLPFRLRKLFLKERVNIIHTHNVNPFFYGVIAAQLTGGIKAVQTDHSRGFFPVSKKEMLSERVLARFTNKVIAVSEGVKADLVKYEHIDHKKIEVIYNGIDPSKYNVEVDLVKKRGELGIGKNAKVIGVGVRLSEQKGICYLIEAVGLIVKSYPDIKLLIIGDGELRIELQRMSEQLGLTDKVIFTGFRPDIPELLKVIDIYALPSLWEGHPLVLLEAMAAGKPIVATEISGNRETVAHGHTGLLVPSKDVPKLADALCRLLADETLRHDMGLNGHKRFQERFTIDQAICKYQELYETL